MFGGKEASLASTLANGSMFWKSLKYPTDDGVSGPELPLRLWSVVLVPELMTMPLEMAESWVTILRRWVRGSTGVVESSSTDSESRLPVNLREGELAFVADVVLDIGTPGRS